MENTVEHASLPDKPVRPVRPGGPVRPGRLGEKEPVVSGPSRPSVKLVPAGAGVPQVGQPAATEEDSLKGSPSQKKKKNSSSGVGQTFRMTERDGQILSFLGRYRFATVGQLARHFDTSETALRNRLPRLEEQGLVTWAWVTQNKPKVWLVTAEGLKTAGLDLREPNIKWGQFRHNIGLVDLGIQFEAAGEVVLTEREIRAGAGRYEPSPRLKKAIEFSRQQANVGEIPADGLSPAQEHERLRRCFIIPMPGRSLGHVPDMVLLRQPYPDGRVGHIAVELELTRKSLGEWRQILAAFRNSDVYDKVHYFVATNEMKKSLSGVIRGLRAEDMITVSVFSPVDLIGDPLTSGSRAK